MLEAGLTPCKGKAFFLALDLLCSQAGNSRVRMALTALTIVLARPLPSMITSGNIPLAMVIGLNIGVLNVRAGDRDHGPAVPVADAVHPAHGGQGDRRDPRHRDRPGDRRLPDRRDRQLVADRRDARRYLLFADVFGVPPEVRGRDLVRLEDAA